MIIWDSVDYFLGLAIGFWLCLRYYKPALPIKVTQLPPEEPKPYKKWSEIVEPLAQRLVVAGTFDLRYTFNPQGALALGKLMREMGGNLDEAVERHLAEYPTLREKVK